MSQTRAYFIQELKDQAVVPVGQFFFFSEKLLHENALFSAKITAL